MVQAYNLELGTIFKQLIELNGLEKGTEIILSWYKEVKLDFHEESRKQLGLPIMINWLKSFQWQSCQS